MPGKDSRRVEVRKAQSLGKSSLGITIPKAWASSVGVEPGSPVYLELRDDGILIRSMGREAARSSSIHVMPSSTVDEVLRMVISSYLRGDESMILKFDVNPSLKEHLFRSIKAKLAGVELIEESPVEAHVKVLSLQTQLPLGKLMSRMWLTVRGMLRDSLELIGNSDGELVEDVTARDDEVDRTYLLIHRLINMAIAGTISLKSVSLENRMELTPYLLVAKSVERSGDHAWRIAQWAPNLVLAEPAMIAMRELGFKVLELSNAALNAFIDKDTGIAMNILNQRNVLLNERMEAMTSMHDVPADSRGFALLVIESLGRIAAYAFDIAETTLDGYS